MSELKTVQDLIGKPTGKDYSTTDIITKIQTQFAEELRQEAVKYVKDALEDSNFKITFIKDNGDYVKFNHQVPKGKYNEETEQNHFLMGRITAMCNFFNITEGDLK